MKKIIAFLICTILCCGLGVNASLLPGEEIYETIVVKQNDTLWDIAAQKVDASMDIRDYIHQIKKLNQINDSGYLSPGQTLKLPVVGK